MNGRFTHGRLGGGRQLGLVMASPKNTSSPNRPRAPAGKKQMLVIMDESVVKSVKLAAVEDDIKMSHAVEAAVRDWLDKRKREKAARSAV